MTVAPQFSAVIPVYNGARYIARAVASALGQVGVRHEVIVVDDGSTDGSGDIAAAVDPSVRVIRCANGGQAAARNRGIRAAGGEIVAFLDADDWWANDKLAAQAALFGADAGLSVVFSDFTSVTEDGHPCGWRGGLVEQLTERGLELSPLTADGYAVGGPVVHSLIRYTSFMHPSTVAVKRALLDGVGLFDETISPAEDLELWIRLAAAGKVGLVGRVLVTTEQRPGSQGRQLFRMPEQLIRLYSKLPQQFPGLPAPLLEHISRFVESKHAGLGWRHRQAGNLAAAREHYRAALRHKLRLRTLTGLLRTYLPAPLR